MVDGAGELETGDRLHCLKFQLHFDARCTNIQYGRNYDDRTDTNRPEALFFFVLAFQLLSPHRGILQ